MYHEFYGLRESPFALTPDPRYLFLSEPHKEALASAIYGVQERKGFVLILGEVGTGKTTLIRHLLGRFGPNIRTVFVFNPGVTFLELLQLILRDLEIPCPSLRRVEMIDALNEYLLAEAAAGRYVVLIVDEAQHLSPAVLEEVRMLSNLETAKGKLIQTILVGQPELGEKLGRPELRQLRQRIGLVAELKPLSLEDATQYIEHRLSVAGRARAPIFSRKALKLVHRASGGIPRLINVICDKALVLGYAASAPTIKARLIREVLKDWAPFRRRRLGGSGGRLRARIRRPRGRVVAAIGVALAGAALLAVGFSQADGEGFWRWLGRLRPAGASTPAPEADTRLRAPAGPVGAAPAPRPAAPVRSPAIPEISPAPPVSPPAPVPALEPPAASPPALPARGSRPGEARAPAGRAAEAVRVAAEEPDARGGGARRPDVVVGPGDVLSRLVAETYGRTDLTMLDFVKAANPELANIDVLLVGQRLRFPAFEPRALVHRVDDSVYRLHLVTVWDTEGSTFSRVRTAVARSGRQLYVTPVALTRSETAFRVMVGPFGDRREAETFYRQMAATLGS